MATTPKAANYSPEQVATMRESYCAAESDEARKAVVENLAEQFGKKIQSIRAKLVREGVYVKVTPTTKTGAAIQKKESIVDAIAKIVPMTEAEASSMAKVNKTALAKILTAVTPTVEETEEEEPEAES